MERLDFTARGQPLAGWNKDLGKLSWWDCPPCCCPPLYFALRTITVMGIVIIPLLLAPAWQTARI